MSHPMPDSMARTTAESAQARPAIGMDDDALLRQLSTWLGATDIGWLELQGPGVHVRLRNDGTRVEPVPAGAPFAEAAGRRGASASAATAATWAVPAPSVGVCLHAHPLHGQPLVAPGQSVAAGDVIALLQVGALLMPVTAPRSGTVVGHAVTAGARVGYGTPLVHLR